MNRSLLIPIVTFGLGLGIGLLVHVSKYDTAIKAPAAANQRLVEGRAMGDSCGVGFAIKRAKRSMIWSRS